MKVRVFRGCRAEESQNQNGKYVEYEIPPQERMTVMNALNHIYEHCDRTLAFYVSCRIGKCKGCLVEVDGKPRLACTTLVKEGMSIGPLKRSRLVRDLVVEIGNHEQPEGKA
jgi:succinate dehydrogenase/fumarate reductase-like Fe-S protein